MESEKHYDIEWERLTSNKFPIFRAKIPGGWLVLTFFAAASDHETRSMTFVPDPDHQWVTGVREYGLGEG